MNDVMLPWPEPRRPKKDRPEPSPSAPRYEIQRVNSDGSTGPVEVLPVTRPPWQAKSGRRGFLGAGIASSVAAALMLSGCDDDDPRPPTSPYPSDSGSTSPYPSPSESSTWPEPSDPPTYPTDVPTYPTDTPAYPTETAPPTGYPDPVDPPTYGSTGGTTTGGGTICTCNKVCTCIPVCQAHELLNADPVVRRMAETVVVAMGTRELPYLRWAAGEAPAPLRSRIEELIGELRDGRRLGPDDLDDPGCEPYLTSADPVIALTAAQFLSLRAVRGEGLTGTAAEHAAHALAAGRALHAERAPAWSV